MLLLSWAAGVVAVVLAAAGVSAEETSVPWWVALVAVGAVVATGVPLHRWLRPAVDAVMYSHRDDAHALIAQFGHFGRTSGGAGADLPQQMATLIATRLRLPYVAIVPAGDALPAGSERFERVPLTFAGEAVGTLVAAPRPREKLLSGTDLALLGELATHVGITLHAVRVSDALRASRAAVITAREEERRRLRRDLHDGLGPTLASLKLHLAAVSQLIADRPERAVEVVDRLRGEVRDTSAQIRSLVYGLRPPMLDDLGLLGAMRSKGDTLRGISVQITAPEPAPELPAAAEVALYRIAAEALTNVERHAGATTVALALAVAPGRVTLTIRDDGRGLPAPFVDGVGVAAMRERAAELGGELTVTAPGDGGTLVVASVPLRAPA